MAYKPYKKGLNDELVELPIYAEVADKLGRNTIGSTTNPIYLNNGQPTQCSMDAYIKNIIYPVGSIYISVNSTNPQTLFGGTWQQMKDRFLLGAGDTYSCGNTGGEATHLLTENEMPSHRHRVWTTNTWSSNAVGLRHSSKSFGFAGVDQSSGSEQWADVESGDSHQMLENTGGNVAHNNMPPYLVVYMWKRIS